MLTSFQPERVGEITFAVCERGRPAICPKVRILRASQGENRVSTSPPMLELRQI